MALRKTSTISATASIPDGPGPTLYLAPTIIWDGMANTKAVCSRGVWYGNPTDYAFEWAVDGAVVDGVTGDEFTPSDGHIGGDLSCKVVAINASGNSSPATATDGGGEVLAYVAPDFTVTSTLQDFRDAYGAAPYLNPAAIHFRTSLSPDGDYRGKEMGTWEWDFGDPGSIHELIPADHEYGRDANYCDLPWGVHVYRQPGTYTVKCKHTDKDGNYFEDQHDVVIGDRAEYFATRQNRVFCVSPSGSPDTVGAPAGAIFVNTLAEAHADKTGGKDLLVLVRKGETHLVDDLYIYAPSPTTLGGKVHMMGTYGDSSLPAILDTGTNPSKAIKTLDKGYKAIFGNILFLGAFDPLDESNARSPGYGIEIGDTTSHLTIDNVFTIGTQNGTRQLGNAEMQGVCVTNSQFESYVAVCHYRANTRNCGFAGCVTLCHPDGLGGGGWRGGTFGTDRHGPHRWIQCYGECVYCCIYFQNGGWGSIMNSYGEQNRPIHQAIWRLNASGHLDTSIGISRCVAEGGWTMVSGFSGGGPYGEKVADNLIQNCTLIGTANTQYPFEIGAPGTQLRNLKAIIPDVPFEIRDMNAWFSRGGGAGLNNPADGSIPIRIQNLTLIYLRSAANGATKVPTVFPEEVYPPGDPRGNLTPYNQLGYATPIATGIAIHAPNAPGAFTSDGPFDETSISSMFPMYKGLNHAPIPTSGDDLTPIAPGTDGLITAFATPDATYATYRHFANSGVADDQTEYIPMKDSLGNLRRNPTSRGVYDDVA